MFVVAVLIQAATASAHGASAAPPAKFSILYNPCTPSAATKDVVVCGKDGTASDRLPLPDAAPPTPGYVKPDSGDYRDNRMAAAPCAARQEGCQVGFGPPIVPLIAAGVKAIGDASKEHRWAKARARDGDRRVAIDLGASAPAGRVEP